MEIEADYKLDQLDKSILTFLIENARTSFSDIAKKLEVAPGTIHGRVRKMEEAGIIKGSSLTVDYERMGYTFTAYIGLILNQTSVSPEVAQQLIKIPEVTVVHLVTGSYSLFCKIRARNTPHAKEVILKINDIPGIVRTESTISLEEIINSKERLMKTMLEEREIR